MSCTFSEEEIKWIHMGRFEHAVVACHQRTQIDPLVIRTSLVKYLRSHANITE